MDCLLFADVFAELFELLKIGREDRCIKVSCDQKNCTCVHPVLKCTVIIIISTFSNEHWIYFSHIITGLGSSNLSSKMFSRFCRRAKDIMCTRVTFSFLNCTCVHFAPKCTTASAKFRKTAHVCTLHPNVRQRHRKHKGPSQLT